MSQARPELKLPQSADHAPQTGNGRPEVVTAGPPMSPDDVKLPQTFLVKYLGKREATGLWGIKHTRKPVDELVAAARSMKKGASLPFLQLHVSERGVMLKATEKNLNNNYESGPFSIESVSYGVQDLVYTRVFAMIVVREGKENQSLSGGVHPFECYAFVCDSRNNARRLTFALAKAFQDFSKTIKSSPEKPRKPKRLAIDLRTPEQIEQDLKNEMDSEV